MSASFEPTLTPVPPVLFSRILLTGGGGFVGSHLAPLLAAAAPAARRVLTAYPGRSPDHPGWTTLEADLVDPRAVEEVVAAVRPDLVVHLAAQSSVGSSTAQKQETWRVNYDATFALACACARHVPEATFFFTSSSEVYGLSFDDGPVDEDSATWPQNVYARSKLAAEMMLSDVLGAPGRVIIVRPFNHTGPGQDERFVLASWAAQVARIERGDQPAELVVGNIGVERDFIDVRDVCDAYVRLLAAAPRLPSHSVFNVGSGAAVPLRVFAEHLQDIARVAYVIRPDAGRVRAHDVTSACGTSRRLRDLTGWHPARDMFATLTELLDDKRREAGTGPRAVPAEPHD